MNKWLSYYHPSTAVFVDDQQAFLTAVKNRLPPHVLALYFNDATKALNKITEEKQPSHENLHRIFEIENLVEVDPQNNNNAFFSLKLGEVCKTIYNPNRFSEISVVIVDRMMPGLNGINFCRQLVDHPVKKIMLTASKDRKIATDAFNEGIIDFFLLKDSPNLISELRTAIASMQKDYFHSLTKQTFGTTLEMLAPLIKNASIANFLQNKMEELSAVEFYILDKDGSVLFMKHDGTPITLVISPGNTIDAYAAIAHEHEEKFISDALFNKEKLLFFPHEMDCMCPVSEWHNFLFEAKPFPEQPNLFYTVIEAPHQQPVNVEKILSQKYYMSKLI